MRCPSSRSAASSCSISLPSAFTRALVSDASSPSFIILPISAESVLRRPRLPSREVWRALRSAYQATTSERSTSATRLRRARSTPSRSFTIRLMSIM